MIRMKVLVSPQNFHVLILNRSEKGYFMQVDVTCVILGSCETKMFKIIFILVLAAFQEMFSYTKPACLIGPGLRQLVFLLF